MVADYSGHAQMNPSILWRRLDLPGHEACRLIAAEDSWRVAGTAVFAFEGQACRLDYSVVCDRTWQTRSASVTGWVGDDTTAVEIQVQPGGRWWLNGVECGEVAGCIDVDLNFSPATNLLPIRRLALGVGQVAEVRAAWLRFPSFRLEPLVQSYRRVEQDRYRYESAGGRFAADLVVNEAGLVTSYGSLWTIERAA
jgi:hypothetical protein